MNHGDRLTTPLIRKNGVFTEASWDEALDYTADKLVEHRGATAALASAKATNEDGYILQKFMRLAPGHQQHRPLHEAVPLAIGGGHAQVPREWGNQQLISRLRKGRVLDHRRL